MKYFLSAVALAVFGIGFMLYKTFSEPFFIGFSIPAQKIEKIVRVNESDYRLVTAQVLEPTAIDVAQVAKQNAPTVDQLFNESKTVIAKLSVCLKEADVCGQANDKSQRYFDPERTPEHRNLNRALMLITEIVDQDPSYLEKLDRATLLRVTQINSDNTPILALQLLERARMTDGELNTVLGNIRHLRGQVRSLVLQNLASDVVQKNPGLRANFVTAVIDSVSDKKDRLTALEVQKNLSQLNLEKEEFALAVNKSCFLRNDGTGEDLWPMLRKNIVMQGESMGYNINPDEYCRE